MNDRSRLVDNRWECVIDTELAEAPPDAAEREFDLRDRPEVRPVGGPGSPRAWWRPLRQRSTARLIQAVRWLGQMRHLGRRRLLLLCAAFVLAVILGGVLAAGAIKSPATVAAEAQPPPLTTLTEPITSRVLSKSIFVAGTVEPRAIFQARASGAADGGRSVFTAVNVKRGDRVAVGQRLVEVSGRPIVVLPGTTPAYRYLLPGTQGKDVEQLQRALAVKRWYRGATSGVMDEDTKAAVARMYSALGYRPVEIGVEELAAGQAQVTSARRALAEANASLKGAKAGSPERGSLERAAGYAREDLAQAEHSRDNAAAKAGPTLPVGEYLFVPTLPATVMEVPAAVGAEANGVAVRLSSGALIVRGVLDPVQRTSVAAGQKAEIVVGDARIAGVVELVEESSAVTDSAGSGGAGPVASQPKMTIVPDEPITASMLGASARVVVTAQTTQTPVLAVPIAAIRSQSSGTTTISVASNGTDYREVEVQPGFLGDGYVEIQPVQGVINEGDLVVVSSHTDGPTVAQPEYQ